MPSLPKHPLRKPFQLLSNSIFGKLFIVFALTLFSIYLITGGFFRQLHHRHQPFQKNLSRYLYHLSEDLGHPPQLEKAQQVTKDLHLNVQYEAATGSWSTNNKIPSLKQLQRRNPNIGSYPRHVRYRRHHYFVLPYAEGHLIYAFSWRSFTGEVPVIWIGVLLGVLSLIIFGCYLLVRRILKPLRLLNEGVDRISKGQLDTRIEVQGKDELAQLSLAFNQMMDQLQSILQSKEQLLLDVSHELRTPITRMKLGLELLPEDVDRSSIVEDLDDMENMIAEILESARLQSTHGQLQLSSHSLNNIMRKALDVLSPQPEWVSLELRNDLPSIEIDADRIEHVFRNLIQNALKYSEPTEKPVVISLYEEESFIKVEIQDFGRGISEDDQALIFEPFYRVDKSRAKQTGGYGLGLAMCKKIIEAHQGKIHLQSTPEQGSIFTVYLPKSV